MLIGGLSSLKKGFQVGVATSKILMPKNYFNAQKN